MKWDDPNQVDMHMDPLLIQDVTAEITKHKSRGWDGKNSAKMRRRGKRGGVRMRLKRQKLTNTNYLHKYRNACIMAFSETWLLSTDSDPEMTISV